MIPLERICHRLRWQDLDTDYLAALIQQAREEDLAGAGLLASLRPQAPGDPASSILPPGLQGQAQLVARRQLVVCGLPLIPLILEVYGEGCRFQRKAMDGDVIDQGGVLGVLSGPSATLLQAERVILNFLQHLSGISTLTRKYVEALGDSPTRLLDTRKTLPGYRMLQKYAVACGDGWNHRLGLYEWPMLKDNHLQASKAAGGQALTTLIQTLKQQNPQQVIQVEVDRLEQLEPVIEGGADLVLLDNFALHVLPEALRLCQGQIRTEASGGVGLAELPELGQLGLDFISTGATVHQSQWVDIGLDWL